MTSTATSTSQQPAPLGNQGSVSPSSKALLEASFAVNPMPDSETKRALAAECVPHHTVPLGLEGRSKFKELLAAGAPRHPIGRFRPRRPGGSGTFSNFELWAPEVAF